MTAESRHTDLPSMEHMFERFILFIIETLMPVLRICSDLPERWQKPGQTHNYYRAALSLSAKPKIDYKFTPDSRIRQ